MVRLSNFGGLAVILGMALIASISAHAASHGGDQKFTDYSKMTPSATAEFEVKSLKLIAGASWGSGTLTYEGKTYPLKVMAGSLGGAGYRSIKATANVYELKKTEDFTGVYTAGGVGATAGKKGGGLLTLENGKGVVMQAKVTDSKGLQLSISLTGLEIEFEE